jgi:hypothetical protein
MWAARLTPDEPRRGIARSPARLRLDSSARVVVWVSSVDTEDPFFPF